MALKLPSITNVLTTDQAAVEGAILVTLGGNISNLVWFKSVALDAVVRTLAVVSVQEAEAAVYQIDQRL